jgi:hypothetical protein
VQYKDYVAGWLASSISDSLDLFASAPENLPYALITCLDSNTEPASLLKKSPLLRSVAHLAKPVGAAIGLPAEALLAANTQASLFFGFDEVWFFPNDQIKPKPNAAWIVGPRRIDRKTMRKLGPWMTSNNCLLGLGDGDGLNLAIKAGGMAKHLIGHSLTQPQPVLSGELE